MRRYRIAFAVAAVTAVATFCLIVLGGIVFNTGSSLACPDWPKCYDQWMPPMKGGILYEHGHRILGALVGLGSLILCGILWQRDSGSRPTLRPFGAALPILVIFQGVLGGLIVLWKLPMLVRAGHLATSMIVLMALIYIARAAWARARGFDSAAQPLTAPPGFRAALPLLGVTLAFVYLQLILGALVRHTNSSEAAGWGLAYSMMGCDLNGNYALWPSDPAARLNLFHRYLALLVAAVVVLCCARCWILLRERLSTRGKLLAWLPALFVLTQILVGVTMLATWNLRIYPSLGISDSGAMTVQVILRTLHLAVGTLTLASLWLFTVVVGQGARVPAPAPEAPGLTQPTPA